MESKELMDKWNNEFKKLLLANNDWKLSDFKNISNGKYLDWKLDAMWEMFLIAKRSQPAVELPNDEDISLLAVDTAGEYDWNTIEAKEEYIKTFTHGALIIIDDISRNLTAAGIQYKVRG